MDEIGVDLVADWNPGLQVLGDLSEPISGRVLSLSTSLGQFNMSYRVG